MPRRRIEHLMTPERYETAVRERFASLYPEPEFEVIGGARCFREGRLSGVPWQIDMGVVRHESPEDLLLVADAKRHGRRLDVTDVEGFLGYLEDIGSPGILASLLGGSPGALRRADAGGADVHVVTYAEALSFDWPNVAAGLYPWDTWGHPTLAEALPLLNRGRTEEFLEVIETLPFEEWATLFSRAPTHLRATASRVLVEIAEFHWDDGWRYNALRVLDESYEPPPSEWLGDLLEREKDHETRELLVRLLGHD